MQDVHHGNSFLMNNLFQTGMDLVWGVGVAAFNFKF